MSQRTVYSFSHAAQDPAKTVCPPQPAPVGERSGQVVSVVGQTIRARMFEARLGDVWRIAIDEAPPLLAQIIGFHYEDVLLMPLGDLGGIAPGARMTPAGSAFRFPTGHGTLGRVLSALGEPMDDMGPISDITLSPLIASPPPAMRRKPNDQLMTTGIRAIDGLLTIGRGQRVGIYAEAGAGKSTLMGMIARFALNRGVDRVVVGLIGERGREVEPFYTGELGAVRAKTTVIASTSDQPALLRMNAAYAATAVAEEARRRGEHVVLMMDSVTRFARALRDVGLSAGEPPARGGYPPSMAQILPRLFERAGNDSTGSITAFYTVLVEGGDMSEPVAHETRSLLDGHIVLSESVPHYPRIDILRSKSRLRNQLISPEHRKLAERLHDMLQLYAEHSDKILINAYRKGTDARIDEAVRCIARANAFLAQGERACSSEAETLQQLTSIFAS